MEKNKKVAPIRIVAEEGQKENKGEFTREDVKLIESMYVAGKPIADIEAALNISRGTLYSYLDRMGVQRRTGMAMTASTRKLLTMSKEDQETLIQRYVSGEKTHDLQREYGITKHALYSLLDREGVPRRGRTGKRKQTNLTTSSKSLAIPKYLVNDTPIQIERDGAVLHINVTPQSDNLITEVRVTFNKE
ncbi:hypothetical protein [Bacillus phage SBSphiJ4]|nr:hypothetical protein [Bacillus phage SBSphiJ2]UPI12670.1 hypothetical protein [Bacillus phage SBSphiJ4]